VEAKEWIFKGKQPVTSQKALLELLHVALAEEGVLPAGIEKRKKAADIMIAMAIFEAREVQDCDPLWSHKNVLGLKIGVLTHKHKLRFAQPFQLRSEPSPDTLAEKGGKPQACATLQESLHGALKAVR
jgi:hypothetical protein